MLMGDRISFYAQIQTCTMLYWKQVSDLKDKGETSLAHINNNRQYPAPIFICWFPDEA